MRKLLLSMTLLCLFVTGAKADYWYKLRLSNIEGYSEDNLDSGWTSDWVHVNAGTNSVYSLGGLWCTVMGYDFSTGEAADGISAADFKIKDDSGNEYTIPANHPEYITGMAFKGESDSNTSILNNTSVSWGAQNDLQCGYWKLRSYIKILDLSAWQATGMGDSYYFAHSNNCVELRLPKHNFNINGEANFANFNNLTKIVFDYDCTSIGKLMFENCYKLPTSEIQKLVHACTSIGDWAFHNADAITTLNLPVIQTIGAGAFNSCDALMKTTIGYTIQTIGNQAFQGCSAMTELTMTGTDENKVQLQSLGEKAFKDCYKLENFYLQTETPNFTSMGDYCFERCHKLSTTAVNSYILPRFQGTTINQGVFRCCCTALTTVTIPASITDIKNKAFHGTNAMEVINFANRDGALTIADARAFSPEEKEDDTYNAASSQGGSHETQALHTVNFGTGTYSIGNAAFMKANSLQNVTVQDGTTISRIGAVAFGDCRPLTSESVNNLLAHTTSGITVEHYAFYGCTGGNLTWVNIPTNVTTLCSGCFGGSETSSIHNITVHSATAPKMDRSKNPLANSGQSSFMKDGQDEIFRNVRPNYVTINFEDGATNHSDYTTGYYSYLKGTANGDGQQEEWTNLLTKTLSSSNTTYDVYPQQHAIVKMTRPLTVGWNTLCLPFATNHSADETGGEYDNTRILQRALNANGGSNFMLAVYRGYREDTNLFRFLKYANYDEDPMDAFETFLVRMDERDLATDNVYTFYNVDLNYKYTASGVNQGFDTTNPAIYNGVTTSGVARTGTPTKQFAGDENKDTAPFNDGNSNYDDYVICGSYVQFIETVPEERTQLTGTVTAFHEGTKTEEGYSMLSDGNSSTKYCTDIDDKSIWMQYQLENATKVTSYSLTSGNDAQQRDPKSWTLVGSNDLSTWTVLDTQANQTFESRQQTKTYMVYGAESYTYYRLNVSETYGSTTMFQLADWLLYDGHLSTKDYFIQHSTADGNDYFYPYVATKKYGVRGFSGWFRFVGETQTAAAKNFIPMAFYDGEFDEPTEIVGLDGEGNIVKAHDVYSIDGRLLRRGVLGTEGLPAGLYIVNGKKVMVK